MFVGTCGIYILIVVATEIYLRAQPAVPAVELVNVAVILLLSFAFAVSMAQLKPEILPSIARTAPMQPSPLPDLAEAALLSALTKKVEEEFAYRTEGLTIKRLAQVMGVQEYRLRRLINGRLGHRNFNEFLNSYRIREVRERLTDPKQAHLPILTIAMESGFSSLGPFNRAFKDTTGITPKQYRAEVAAPAKPDGGRS